MIDLHDDHISDDHISGAYERLGRSLATAGDPLSRIEPAIRRRRTTRRIGVGVGALVLVAGVGGIALATTGGDDKVVAVEPAASPGPTGPESTLRFTHLDGSAFTFAAGSLTVTCAPSDSGGQLLTARTTAPEMSADGDILLAPLLDVEVQIDPSGASRVFQLPFENQSGSSDDRPMSFFFATPEGKPRANELSSAESGSSGTVEILTATCGPTPVLELTVDATLGSELENQGPMAIAGYYHS